MTSPPPARDEPIVIVGAGIMGLSTAIHLARRGYRDVTVFDKQPFDESQYSYMRGADAASADINKIVRSTYGSQTEYQELTMEAIAGWDEWNRELALGRIVPPGMGTGDRVFVRNGSVSLSSSAALPAWERASIESMEAAGRPDVHLSTADARHRGVARRRGLAHALDPFQRAPRGLPFSGVLDTAGGMAVADKACRFALHYARLLGARFVFGPEAGFFESFRREGGAVTGIRTRDGRTHRAALTLVACGGWTPVLVPELDGLCEATAGSVALLKIPRSSPLWDRLGPDNFPTFMWNMRDGAEGGLYGFPRNEDGWFKVGYRGTKYTNPLTHKDGKQRSTPVTRWSEACRNGAEPVGDRLTSCPQQALKVIRGFLDENLPELAAEGIKVDMTRICWYSDSYDNHLIVDRVPGTKGLMVATGDSGHAFKYLPTIGNWIVDVMENIGVDRPAVKAWRWRQKGAREEPVNVLMEGSKSSRAFENIPWSKESDLKVDARSQL